MECSVIDKRYMNCGVGEKALSVFTSLKQACKNVGEIIHYYGIIRDPIQMKCVICILMFLTIN